MKIKTLCALVLLTLTASLASAQSITRCGGPTTALYINWPTFGFDVCHTGYNPYESTLKPTNVRNLVLAWQYPTQNAATTPALVNGVAYFGSVNGSFYAVNAITGTLLWTYPTFSFITSEITPAVANGLVYFGAQSQSLYALDATTGELQWRFTTGSFIESSPTVDSGTVYVTSEDGNLYALDAKSGTFLWEYALSGSGSGSAPAVVNGVVYVVSDDANVYALNARTGVLL